jgi:hypothetical protein
VPTLDYETPSSPRRKPPGRFFYWLVIAILIATIYFFTADFYAYVDDGVRPKWKKFEMPLWWKLGESFVAGAIGSYLLIALVSIVRCVVTRFHLRGGSSANSTRLT